MNNLFLNSIDITPAPAHTQICIACQSCSHKCTCAFQQDYLKVVTLIQNILGDPQKDYEILENDDGFTGINFEDNSIFPNEIQALATHGTEEVTGTFLSAKWSTLKKVKVLYKIEDYYVMFIFTYDDAFERFIYSIGTELYYGIQYTMMEGSANEIITVLDTWKEEMEEQASQEKDIINTTPFTASLACKYYSKQYIKGTTRDYTNHNCDIENDYRHVATYHMENELINPTHYPNKPVELAYPWFIPVPAHKKHKQPPKRRDDM